MGNPQNVIQTARLDLRRLHAGDAPFILELLNEAAFLRFIGDKGVRSLEDARAYIAQGPGQSYRQHGFGLYAVMLRVTGEPVGICGLVRREGLDHPDVGFAFLERHRGHGYAVESAAAVLAYAKTLGLKAVLAITDPDNRASMAVLEKIGFRFQGKIRLAADGPEVNLLGVPDPA